MKEESLPFIVHSFHGDACGNVINEADFSFTEMLSPSSHVQKDNSKEDSSRTEAGLEPKTDRFGFIVTGRSTAG